MPRVSRFSSQDFDAMRSLYAQGQSTKQIAVLFGTDGGTIYHHLERMGLEFRTLSQSKKQYSVREAAFAQIDTEATAYWLGFLYADGYVRDEHGRGRVALWLSEKDKGHLEAFGEFMQSTYPMKTDTIRKACGFSIASDRMRDDLIRWGCTPRKSLALRFPPLPLPLCSHFIRGYFDGDGSAFVSGRGKTPTISLLGNLEFLEAVDIQIFIGTNVNGTFHRHTKSGAYYLVYRGEFKATSVGRWLYHDAACWLERKRGIIAQFNPGKRMAYQSGPYKYM